jgi:hypothetical protein
VQKKDSEKDPGDAPNALPYKPPLFQNKTPAAPDWVQKSVEMFMNGESTPLSVAAAEWMQKEKTAKPNWVEKLAEKGFAVTSGIKTVKLHPDSEFFGKVQSIAAALVKQGVMEVPPGWVLVTDGDKYVPSTVKVEYDISMQQWLLSGSYGLVKIGKVSVEDNPEKFAALLPPQPDKAALLNLYMEMVGAVTKNDLPDWVLDAHEGVAKVDQKVPLQLWQKPGALHATAVKAEGPSVSLTLYGHSIDVGLPMGWLTDQYVTDVKDNYDHNVQRARTVLEGWLHPGLPVLLTTRVKTVLKRTKEHLYQLPALEGSCWRTIAAMIRLITCCDKKTAQTAQSLYLAVSVLRYYMHTGGGIKSILRHVDAKDAYFDANLHAEEVNKLLPHATEDSQGWCMQSDCTMKSYANLLEVPEGVEFHQYRVNLNNGRYRMVCLCELHAQLFGDVL